MKEAILSIHGQVSQTGEGVGVALLDTGICPMADFLQPKNRIFAFRDFVNGHDAPYDDNGHGTHVAGIVGGNGIYRGVAPGCRLICLKILDECGHGTAESIFLALKWVKQHALTYGIRVVNLSVGTNDPSLRYPLIQLVEELWEMGLLVVAAAGNDGAQGITAPGVCRKILTVGCAEERMVFPFREDGQLYYKPDLFAPGENIISCKADSFSFAGKRRKKERVVGEHYVKMSGTSMATPMVSGACALLLEKNPYLTADEVKERLVKSAVQRRMLNIAAALQEDGEKM